MNESQSVVVEASFQTINELRQVLKKAGLESEIVAPPGCDPNG